MGSPSERPAGQAWCQGRRVVEAPALVLDGGPLPLGNSLPRQPPAGDALAAGLGRWAPPAGTGWSQSERLWWLLWGRCPGVGWTRLRALAAAFSSAAAAWEAPASALAALPGWSAALAVRVEAWRAACGPDPLAALARGRRVLLPGDLPWPPSLAALQRPPLALYWRGRGSLWPLLRQSRAVAVVGTRHPSPHGLTVASRLGQALARAGWPVVSGLAEGIDGAVHRGCLRAGGAPVGVLGTPLERAYPRHHASLQQQVGQQGVLVSEQPPGTVVQAGHFACRNRLQVALAQAVVVVECPLASGALHSASMAWEQGLPLWVVPADTGRASAAGSNRLLAQGATPLLDVADLIDQLGPGPLAGASPPLAPSLAQPSCSPPPRQRQLLEAVGAGASLEQLVLALGQPAQALMADLLHLELEGELLAEPGLRWRPA